jgi:hypothetical protein
LEKPDWNRGKSRADRFGETGAWRRQSESLGRSAALLRAELEASFQADEAKMKQCPQVWLTAKGTSKWSFKLKGVLPPGKYVVYARAVDGAGLAETSFSRMLRNRYGFRVLASKPR